MEQNHLLDLPSVVVSNIISILKTLDIRYVRSVDFFFKDLCKSMFGVWISEAKLITKLN